MAKASQFKCRGPAAERPRGATDQKTGSSIQLRGCPEWYESLLLVCSLEESKEWEDGGGWYFAYLIPPQKVSLPLFFRVGEGAVLRRKKTVTSMKERTPVLLFLALQWTCFIYSIGGKWMKFILIIFTVFFTSSACPCPLGDNSFVCQCNAFSSLQFLFG